MSKTKLYLSIGWVLWLVDNGFDLVFYSIERYDGEKLTIYLLEQVKSEYERTKFNDFKSLGMKLASIYLYLKFMMSVLMVSWCK